MAAKNDSGTIKNEAAYLVWTVSLRQPACLTMTASLFNYDS